MYKSFTLSLLFAGAMAKGFGGNGSGRVAQDPLYETFNAKFNKGPTSVGEYLLRQRIFESNMNMINQHNAQADENDSQALKLAMNHTGDLTQAEYSSLITLNQAEANAMKTTLEMGPTHLESGLGVAAAGVDLAADGYMHPVKNQGGCGSCWTFAANTALEGSMAKKYDQKALHVSEQQIVDCTNTKNKDNEAQFGKDYGAWGCEGGWMANSWNFHKDQGFMVEADYKYESGKSGKEHECRHDKSKTKGNVTSYGQIRDSVASMKEKVKTHPLAVALDAGKGAFQFYSSGVVKASDGCGDTLNHAVVIVGYQDADDKPEPKPAKDCTVSKWWHSCEESDDSVKLHADANGNSNYWKVQNSWGTGWGDEGFILIEIADGDGVCGINGVVQWAEGEISAN